MRRLLWDTTEIGPLDAFPKDPPQCWVFPEAELAVAVFVARRVAAPGTLRVRTHECRQIDETAFAEIALTDSTMLDEATVPVPIVRPEDLPVLHRLYEADGMVRFKDVAPCHVGEINSQYGQDFMRGEPTGRLLIRGRHVARYRLDERASSDTATRWIDEDAYIAALGDPESRPALRPRVAKQAITDLNDPRRIIAAICPGDRYLLDSCDYRQPAEPYNPAYVLAILLSDVAEGRFRMTSSNNNVNAYEIDELPLPAIADWDAPSRADTVAHVAPLALNLAQSMDPERDSTQLITDALADGASRAAIHDVIVQMVEQVLTMRGEAFAQLDTFSVMLRALPNGHRLTEEFAMGGWVEFEEDAFFGELTVRRVRLSLEEVARVRAERRAAMATLRPMVARSDRLDRALNSFALALFGVADDEREVIRSAVTPGPSFLPSLAAV